MSSLKLTLTSPSKTYSFSGEGKDKILIGRSLRCEFSVPVEEISREHCLIEVEDENYYITDLDSSNGVWVDQVKILPRTRVKISEKSAIVLSKSYVLNLNPPEMKTRSGYVIRTIDTEVNTRTFELIIPGEKKKKKKPEITTLIESENQKAQSREMIKMIIGFLVVLGFIIYQMAIK